MENLLKKNIEDLLDKPPYHLPMIIKICNEYYIDCQYRGNDFKGRAKSLEECLHQWSEFVDRINQEKPLHHVS